MESSQNSSIQTLSVESLATLSTELSTIDLSDSQSIDKTHSRNLSISSTTSSNRVFCRFCHLADQTQDLVSPCYCTGTMGSVHRECLQRWALTSSSSRCICGYIFKCKTQSPSFLKWPRAVLFERSYHIELLVIVLMLLATPLIIGATFISVLIGCGKSYVFIRPLLRTLWGITILSWILYMIMIYCSFRFLRQSFNAWKKNNLVVKIIWDNDEKFKEKNLEV